LRLIDEPIYEKDAQNLDAGSPQPYSRAMINAATSLLALRRLRIFAVWAVVRV